MASLLSLLACLVVVWGALACAVVVGGSRMGVVVVGGGGDAADGDVAPAFQVRK